MTTFLTFDGPNPLTSLSAPDLADLFLTYDISESEGKKTSLAELVDVIEVNLDFDGGLSTPAQITSTVGIGTAPFVITSTTQVANLNVSFLGGFAATDFALLASPTFTGAPLAPTATQGTNTTQLATTEFVISEISAIGLGTIATQDAAALSVGTLSATGQITSTVATNTAPFVIASTTEVANLNAALLQGFSASDFLSADSPALTGTPTAPTAALGTDTTQLATTAFVINEIDALASPYGKTLIDDADAAAARATLGLGTIATQDSTSLTVDALTANGQITSNVSDGTAPFVVNSNTEVANLRASAVGSLRGDEIAPLASPALTGTPTAPTALANTNTTQVATTAFVMTEISDLNLGSIATQNSSAISVGTLSASGQITSTLADGTAPFVVASTTKVENLNADLLDGLSASDFISAVSPAFTGTPTAPTAPEGTNTTQLATTAYVRTDVDAEIAALIDGAPTALNTLNKLAFSIGDDADFTGTITNQLNQKLDSSGVTAFGETLIGSSNASAARVNLALGNLALENKTDFTVDTIRVNDPIISNVSDGTPPLTITSTTQVDNLNAEFLGGLSPSDFTSSNSPNFTGIPTAPTASLGTNTTQIATTAFVASGLAALVDSAPSNMNTLKELSSALGNNANFSTDINNAIDLKLDTSATSVYGRTLIDDADAAAARSTLGLGTIATEIAADYATLASPVFTGTPTAPTASQGTNTDQLATTAFVRSELSSLVDSAPSTLDTLNELAAALGDDPNFATTVANDIGEKLDASAVGTIASQDADAVNIDGGAIDGTAIGSNSQSTGNFTSGYYTDNFTIGNTTSSSFLSVSPALNDDYLSNYTITTLANSHVVIWNRADSVSYPECYSRIYLWSGASNAGGVTLNGVRVGSGSADFTIQSASSANAIERMRITHTGRVLIGTSDYDGTPETGKLTIQTDSESDRNIVARSSAGVNTFTVNGDGSVSQASDLTLTGGNITTNSGSIDSGASVSATTFVSCAEARFATVVNETEFVELGSGGTYSVDGTQSIYLVSSLNGVTTMQLPAPGSHNGRVITFKKTDNSSNNVTIDGNGNNIDNVGSLNLDAYGDYITVISNGSQWFIINRFGV